MFFLTRISSTLVAFLCLNSEGQSAAIPVASMEFAAICLRNALLLLPEHQQQDIKTEIGSKTSSHSGSTESGSENSDACRSHTQQTRNTHDTRTINNHNTNRLTNFTHTCVSTQLSAPFSVSMILCTNHWFHSSPEIQFE